MVADAGCRRRPLTEMFTPPSMATGVEGKLVIQAPPPGPKKRAIVDSVCSQGAVKGSVKDEAVEVVWKLSRKDTTPAPGHENSFA